MTPEEIASLRRKFESLLEKARNRHVPTVVLWGPGARNAAGFRKRLKIKDNIRQESPEASVILPDDRDVQSATEPYVRDRDLQEVFQALAVDLVFALDVAPGVAQEVVRYSWIESIARKLIVISHDSNRGGYAGLVRRKLNVEFFSEEELRLCDRASEYCREQVRAWLIRKVAEAGL